MKEERRKYRRVRDGIKIIYKVLGVAGEWDLAVINLGGGGLCVPLKQKLGKGTLLELNIQLYREKDPFFVLGKVVWQSKVPLEKEGKGYYETGVEFVRLGIRERMRLIRYVYKKLRERVCEKALTNSGK